MKTLILCLGFCLQGYTYSFTSDFQSGFYWGDFPIPMKKYVIDPVDGPRLNNLVNQAVQEWEDVIGSDVWDVGPSYIVSSSFSGNLIRWSFDFGAETGWDSQTTLAVTTRWSEGTYMIKTEIVLNGNHPMLYNDIGGILYPTILHELGHTIGIGHSNMPSVMQASLGPYSSLQEDDISAGVVVVSEHKTRASSGFVAASAQKDENGLTDAVGCGVISTGSGPGGGLGAFLMCFFMGMFLSCGHSKHLAL